MENHNDFKLVQKAKEGNMKAFRILVDRHKKGIYSLCYQMTGSHADADDLSQDTFIKVHESIYRFRMQASFFTWVRKIAYNLTLNYIKRKQRYREEPINYKTEKESTVQYPKAFISEDPRCQLMQNELGKKITEAIFSLPAELRASAELIIKEGLSYKEAAKIQGCPEGTIFWRIYQARKMLKEKLEPYIEHYEYRLERKEGI